MKSVSADLNNYLNQEKNFETCDLYRLELKNGAVYYIANYDIDVIYNGHVWEHNKGLFTREQTKLTGEPTVDTVSVVIACDKNDTIEDKEHNSVPLMKAAHEGFLDQGKLTLYKAYFRDNSVIGVLPIFEGRTEIEQAGGLQIELTIKSVMQGLAQLVPIRIFAPQSAYTNANGVIESSSADTATMLIPLKPSGKVLIKI